MAGDTHKVSLAMRYRAAFGDEHVPVPYSDCASTSNLSADRQSEHGPREKPKGTHVYLTGGQVDRATLHSGVTHVTEDRTAPLCRQERTI